MTEDFWKNLIGILDPVGVAILTIVSIGGYSADAAWDFVGFLDPEIVGPFCGAGVVAVRGAALKMRQEWKAKMQDKWLIGNQDAIMLQFINADDTEAAMRMRREQEAFKIGYSTDEEFAGVLKEIFEGYLGRSAGAT